MSPSCAQGPWIQEKIPNPDYYEDPEPLKSIGRIGAVAFEVGMMRAGDDDRRGGQSRHLPVSLCLLTYVLGKSSCLLTQLWTIDEGYTFDNVYVGQDAEEAARLRKELWEPRYKAEVSRSTRLIPL